MDTRKNLGAVGPVAAQGTVRLQVAGRGGVPASGVAAVVLNVTVTAPTKSGYVTAYPDGTTLPTASNLNFTAGQTIPNLVIVKVGSNGKVALKNSSAGTVQLIADVAGYYLDGTPQTAGAFTSLSPSRLMDTRKNLGAVGPVAAQGTVRLQVAGRGGVPASGVAAVVLNVTVTAPTKSGYVTAYPDGTTLPTASNLNFTAGQTIPNLVIVKVGSNGKVALKNSSAGTVQLIADVAGYYLDAITVGAISGKVTDSAGNGLAGPVVEMSSPTVGGGAGDVNSDGTFNTGFFLPVADDYTVCFRTYGDETGGISDAFGYLDACWSGLVAVVAGKVTSGINVALPTGGAIEGRVVDSSNQPIQDVRVSVSSDSTNSSRTVWTNADGTYRAKGLATASDFHVCFYPTDDTLTSKCWNNQPWDGSPDPVSATAGAIRSGIDAVLEPAP
jgi:hypothetical protein